MVKAFRLKSTVETRFVYLYDSLGSVLEHWDAIAIALDICRGDAVEKEKVLVPYLDSAMKVQCQSLLSVLAVLRSAISEISGSKSASLSHSIKVWQEVTACTSPVPGDSALMRKLKLGLANELHTVSVF